MSNDDHYIWQSPETSYLATQQHALIRIVSIIITFLFWFSLAMFFLALQLLHVLSLDRLLQLNLVLTTIGISPVLLTVLTWRGIEWTCSFYIRKYIAKFWKMKT